VGFDDGDAEIVQSRRQLHHTISDEDVTSKGEGTHRVAGAGLAALALDTGGCIRTH